MLSGKDYSEVVGRIMVDTVKKARGSGYYDSKEVDRVVKRLFGFKSWSAGRFESLMDEITREDMASYLSSDSTIMKIAEFTMRRPAPTYGKLKTMIAGDSSIRDPSDTINAYIKLLCHPTASFNGYGYYSTTITDQTKCPLSPAMEIVFIETFFNPAFSIPLSIGAVDATFTAAFEIDDVIEHFCDPETNDFFMDYDGISKGRDGDAYDGSTGLDRLKAEEWGFQKDRVVLAMISAFMDRVRRRNYYFYYASWQPGKEENCRTLLAAFSSNRFVPVEFDYLFPLFRLSKTKARDYGDTIVVEPYYKKALTSLLSSLEKDRWYSAEDLWKAYKEVCPNLGFSAIDDIFSVAMYKAAGYADGLDVEGGSDDQMRAREEQLYRRPLFYGLLYIYALFGCIKIREKDAPLTVKRNTRSLMPYSPFDCLDAVCVTDYGEWALGITDRKPKNNRASFTLPVADQNLLLVTYKGKDFKIKQFLGSIGTPILDFRWKVSAETFAAGCTSLNQIEKRIEAFRNTITQDPPANWVAFFEGLRSDFGLSKVVAYGCVIEVANKKRFRQLIATSKELASLLVRLDDDHYFLHNANGKEFYRIMKDLGVPCPISNASEAEFSGNRF